MNPVGHLLRVGSSNRDRVDPQSDLEENLLEVFTLGLLKVASRRAAVAPLELDLHRRGE